MPEKYREDSFSLDHFYTSSTNTKGFSSQMRVSLDPATMRAITIALDSKRFPYETRQDFVRDSIVKNIHHLMADLKEGPREEVRRLIAQEQILATLQAHVRAEKNEAHAVNEFEDYLTGLQFSEEMRITEGVKQAKNLLDQMIYPTPRNRLQSLITKFDR